MAGLITLPASTAEAKVMLGSAVSKGRVKTQELVGKSSSMAASLLSTTMTFTLVLAVSIFLYGTFYYAYMPVEMVNLPVNLVFEPCEGQTAARCTFPTASLSMARHQQLLQGQAYSIRLSLEVPDSLSNEQLGMFMACMNVTGKDTSVISKSCKSSGITYRSPLLRTLETLAFLPALLTGWSSQRQSLEINFFEDFHPDPHRPAQAYHVQLKSALLQVTSAKLHLEASLLGLRHLMYRHSWLAAILGIGTNIAVCLVIIAVSWTRFRMGHTEIARAQFELEKEDVEDSDDTVEEQEEQEAAVEDEVKEQEVGEAGQTLGSRLKGFLISLTFKVLLQLLRVVSMAVLAILCYECITQGPDATRESLVEATKEDLVSLFRILLQQLAPLLAKLQQ